MANETTYDVYTLAKGRWILDARFKKHQRERAIDEGKQLEKQHGIESVKVVREIYDSDDSLISEKIVYKTAGEGIGSSGAGGGGSGGAHSAGPSWFDEGGGDDPGKESERGHRSARLRWKNPRPQASLAMARVSSVRTLARAVPDFSTSMT